MDINEIKKWFDVTRNGGLFEIRILGERNFSGYFYGVDDVVRALQPYDNYDIYYTVNTLKDACSSRKQFGQIISVKKATSKDDISHRWWVPIDVDCVRPSDTCSTDEEKHQAHLRAANVYSLLVSAHLPEPVVCDSSSGYHILIPCDMENDQRSEAAVKTFLDTLSELFSDDAVKIDTVLYDANRVLRLPGTFSRKGRNTAERPQRMARILKVPAEMKRMSVEMLEAFNAQYHIEHEKVVRRQYGETFDIRDFLAKHLNVKKEMGMTDGTKWELETCPFCNNEKAAVFERKDGSLGFHCFHNSCKGKTWRDVRLMFEPNAYDRPYEDIRQPQRVPMPAKREEIIPETQEKGKKWLIMSDIKRLNIEDFEKIETGFKNLDNKIKGLFMSELTILSGSNGSGKSSWLNTLILNVIDGGNKVALWSGELRADVLKVWIQLAAAGPERNGKIKCISDNFYRVKDVYVQHIDRWLDGKLFVYNNEYGTKWEQIFNDMQILVDMGVKLFVLDNLMALDIKILADEKNEMQREVVLRLKNFVKEKMVHVILVAHPRKTVNFLRKEDISGSADLANAVDNILIMHRVNNDFKRRLNDFEPGRADTFKERGNVIEVAKNRMLGVLDFFEFQYNSECRRFSEMGGEIYKRYSWDFSPDEGDPTPSWSDVMNAQEQEALRRLNEQKPDDDCPF